MNNNHLPTDVNNNINTSELNFSFSTTGSSLELRSPSTLSVFNPLDPSSTGVSQPLKNNFYLRKCDDSDPPHKKQRFQNSTALPRTKHLTSINNE